MGVIYGWTLEVRRTGTTWGVFGGPEGQPRALIEGDFPTWNAADRRRDYLEADLVIDRLERGRQ